MNHPHLHLMINHIPVAGAFLGTILLAAAEIRKSAELAAAAMILLVLTAIGGMAAGASGESAEEAVGSRPWIVAGIAHEHEEAAEFATGASIASGVLALVSIAFLWKRPARPAALRVLTLVAALVTCAAMARAAYLGGLIRHDEIRGSAAETPPVSPVG